MKSHRPRHRKPEVLGRVIRCIVLVGFCTVSLVVSACSGTPPASTRGTARAAAGSAAPSDAAASGVPETPTCTADNPFCEPPAPIVPTSTGAPTLSTSTDCGAVPIDLKPAGVNIMIAVQGAASMNMHWPRIQSAIRELRTSHPLASFGLQLFWADGMRFNAQPPAETADASVMVNKTNNFCGETQNKVLDVGDHTADQLVSFLGDAAPGPSYLGGLYQISPVVDAINYYLSNATKLADPKRTNYLLLVSDGNDNCFGTVLATSAYKLVAYEKVAVELKKRNIRTIPIGFDAASSSGSFGTVMPNTDLEVLGTLLKHGGSGLKSVPAVDDPAKLAEVVAQVGKNVSNCRFDIPTTLDSSAAMNPFELTFNINGKLVPRDRHELNGWNFVNGSTNQVEFYGQGCQALQAGQMLQAKKSCEKDICGTAAVSVQTKPRAVLLLLDSSASRLECLDGSLSCLVPPTAGFERSQTYWEIVMRAANVSLVSPVNDDVEFGLQFFPSKNSDALTCDVGTKPEVAPALGTHVTIIKQMLEMLPFGFSPDVGIMESVAAAPGRLADPSVVGTVVLLSDGGDNCAGVEQAQVVSRLGGAAKKLFDAGVKTYAIRYGSTDSETPEQAEQLTALVKNGGTALSGAVPYIDAKNENELTSALASISDQLATCSFTLANLAPNIDKNRANLFLNGEVIGFDAKAQKQDGWSWLDASRTSIELYGEACTAFKTNRRTSVVVEFGCEPMVIKGPD